MMDDERGPDRRSSPDLHAATRKRKASRGLRVPNDPVPRASSPDIARVSIADEREIDEFGDRVTQVERASSEAQALIARADGDGGTDADAAAPPPVVAINIREAEANENAATVIDDEARVAVDPTPAQAATTAPEQSVRTSPSGSHIVSVSDEGSVVVRQVRRKIRSIGTDEPMPARHDDGPDLSETDEAVVDEVEEVTPYVAALSQPRPPSAPPPAAPTAARRSSLLPPAIASADEREPSLEELSARAVKPAPLPTLSRLSDDLDSETADEVEVDSAEVEEAHAPAAPIESRARSLPPPPPAATARAAKSEPPASIIVADDDAPSVEDAAEVEAASVEVEGDEDVKVESVDAADGGADVEVEEPTEEISLPLEVEARPSQAPTPPPRASSDGSRPPPPPRTDGPKPQDRPTMVSADAKPRRRQWWEEIFNDDYLRTQRKYTPEQTTSEGNFIEASLGVEKGASVLDVGCGIGRQAVELATRGYEVLGMDLSLAMLSRASDLAQHRGAKLNFLQSDMLEMEFSELFDAAYCVGSTFGFFDEDKNADVIHRLHRALKPGGTLLLEVVNRDCAAGQHPSMTWYEADSCVCMEETHFNWFTSRLEGKRTLLLEDGRQREQKFSMRMYSLHELGKLLNVAGFRVIEVSGHQKTPGAFFGTASQMLIILAQKRTDDE